MVAVAVVLKGVVWVLRIVELFSVFGSLVVVFVERMFVVVVAFVVVVVECVESGVINSLKVFVKKPLNKKLY